ncbi:MAG: hypothetical protein Q8P84_08380 [Deltaproteobacteria bacterium]|nr:hypothetical protein [Deltaproteobacteria bacterium]
MTQKLQAPDFPTLWKVTDRLETVAIAYMLTGSMAVNVYGQARATNDIDMVIQIGLENVKKLLKLFEKDFYISEEALQEAVRHESMFNVIDNETIFKVDFIVAKNDPFSKQQFARRQKIKIADKTIYVISPEDLILSKLEWSKESLSEMQERDIKNILKTLGSSLDKQYLEKWAKTKKMEERLKNLYATL